ncbi:MULTISPECIES: hypothetical protein, partial [unclassified Rhizobium]|uniref:hypothetical protein n=1 Tax=unclassified Rhizobium TaxID=2613769 RepID=UPI0037F60F39
SISIAANPGNTRAKDFVASSAAALVSDRAYRECTAPPSIGVLREITKILQDTDFIMFSNARFRHLSQGASQTSFTGVWSGHLAGDWGIAHRNSPRASDIPSFAAHQSG